MSHTNETDVHKHVPVEKARAAEKTGRVRVILGVSFVLAIIALGIVLYFFASPGAQPPTAQ